MKKVIKIIFIILLISIISFLVIRYRNNILNFFRHIYPDKEVIPSSYDLNNIPEYDGREYVIINNNIPDFENIYDTSTSYELYSNLDTLGRCGPALANIGIDLMPTDNRKSISNVKPTGWQQAEYDNISGRYLYNRCHLIGYQLTGEQANKNNLITCTKQTNVGVMLEYENKVAEYIRNTKNHVLYRVTPYFKDSNLLASGIQMEAFSIEDNGKGVKFNIYVYNVQDGIELNYLNGESKLLIN